MEGVSRQANFRGFPERRLSAFRVLRASDELVTPNGERVNRRRGGRQARVGRVRRTRPRDLAQESLVVEPAVTAGGRGAPPSPCPELPRAPNGHARGACQRQPGQPKKVSKAAPTFFGTISQVPVLTSDFTGGIQDAPS